MYHRAMNTADTGLVTVGSTDIQVVRVYPEGAATTRLAMIQVGPRGGITFIAAELTDDQRSQLIELLGGTV